MRAIDFFIATLRAATLANLFICLYKAYQLANTAEDILDTGHESLSTRIILMEQAANQLFLVTIPNAQKQRHEPMIVPQPIPTSKGIRPYCKKCIDQARAQSLQAPELVIADVCWAILICRIKADDAWLARHFDPDGKLKPYDPQDMDSYRLHHVMNEVKRIIRRTKRIV